MKKNSFKRFLAVTLAAATALTFAPVSTLGLSGVIEAQAAATNAQAGVAIENGGEYTLSAASTKNSTLAVEPGKTVSFTADTANALTTSETSVYSATGTKLFTYSMSPAGGTSTSTIVTVKGIAAGTAATGTDTISVAGVNSQTLKVDVTVSAIGKSDKLEYADTNYVEATDTKSVAFTFTAKDADLAAGQISAKILDSKGNDVAKTKLDTDAASQNVTVDSTTKKGTATITVTAKSGITATDIGAYTLKVNTTADGDTGVSIPFYVVKPGATNATAASASNVSVSAGSTVEVPVTFTGAVDYDQFAVSNDTSAGQTATGFTTKLSYIKDNKGTVKITVPVAATAGDYVYKIEDNNSNQIGSSSFTVTVAGAKLSVSAKDLVVNGDKQIFSVITPSATDKYKVSITNADGTDVTTSFMLYSATSATSADNTKLTNDGSDSASGNEAWFAVKALTGVTAGTYTVKVTDISTGSNTAAADSSDEIATDTFKVTASGSDNGKTDDTTKTTAVNSDIFGGVTTSILATDKTNYSLVNKNATFKLDGVSYTADQLKWYLTTAPNSTPQNMGFTQGEAVIDASGATTVGKLDIHVNNATIFAANASGKAYVEGVYTSGAQNKVVYSHVLTVKAEDKMVTRTYDAGTISKNLSEVNNKPLSKDFLDSTTFIGTNNKFLDGSTSSLGEAVSSGRNFNVTFVDASGSDKTAKGSSIQSNNAITSNGVYYEKYYVVYTDNTEANANFVAEISVNVSVNAGPVVEVKEGNFVYSNTTGVKDDTKVIDLDLATNKTFDLKAHTFSNKDNTSYTYSIDTQNVTEKDGVITAAKEGTAVVTITPKADGVEGPKVYVFFRVNKNANDQITVTGEGGDKATVLSTRQYNGNSRKLTSEYALAAAQVGYVQVEVTGDETLDKKETLTVNATGTKSFALANDPVHGESIDSKTGVITISHDYLNKCDKAGTNPAYVFPVKVTSSETSTSALTTGYFYVVVDYADAKLSGVQDSYDVGTSLTETLPSSWLNLGLDTTEGPVHVSSNAAVKTDVLNKYDALDDSKIYTDDDENAFDWTGNGSSDNGVERATIEGKTEHVLVYASDYTNKVGFTAKVVTLKSVAGKHNYVTKIENVATGKTIYEAGSAVSGASITIDKATKVKVTVANIPSASLNPKYDPAFTIGEGTNSFNYNTNNLFVAATEDPKTFEVTLIPSIEGTQIISINPTEGRLSESDYSLIDTESFKLAVKYDSKAATTTPAKVTGLKVTNAKGAKVTVKFNKVTTYPTMRYYVQKKIGKKTGGKSVGSTKTTLSVKKGATIKVRVKAYYYDENGTKHVGKYSAWKTLKTDKK